MNRYPSKEMVNHLKETYPAGTRVELIEMEDAYRTLPAGLHGTVVAVDALGTIHINWDNGSTLGAVYGVDRISKLTEEIQ